MPSSVISYSSSEEENSVHSSDEWSDVEPENEIKNLKVPTINVEDYDENRKIAVKTTEFDNVLAEKDKMIFDQKEKILKQKEHIRELERKCKDYEKELENLSKSLLGLHLTTAKHVFSHPAIDASRMTKGNPKSLIDDAVKKIEDRKEFRFYVGATSDPNTRCKHHIRNKGFKKMHILYATSDLFQAMVFEDLVLDKIYDTIGCTNRKRTSCGLVQNKTVYYIYFME